jgi:DNA-binding SARP family transcriptional activator/WD40 repeat protein/molybdopterin-guanine dinucleotide biosynthesis protein
MPVDEIQATRSRAEGEAGEGADMTEVRVLGPIEVVVDGRPVAIGSAQLRRLLAVLTVHRDTVVSADRLIDELWGDAAPMNAPKTLARSVYKLRAALANGRADDSLLATQAPGYVLHLDGNLDATQFERRVTEARARLSGADPDGALALLDEGLAMWRGDALDEFATDDFARAEVARLDGLRAAAMDERGEIELALGRHEQLLVELPHAIDRYPLRERFRRQLMLALYRSGRHAEALRAYSDFRAHLGDELGLEPSRELQDLDRAIARQDPELDWAHTGLVSMAEPPRARTRRLPSGLVTFVITDIESSTRLLRRLGARYPVALERHRQILRAAVAAEGGVELNTEGDGTVFAFDDASSAMAACVESQRGLRAESCPDDAELRVRMGVHSGEAEPINDDYVALAVHQAARVKDCAHGAQILVSETTMAAATRRPSATSLGRLPVRDFDDGIELFQLTHADLPSDFPPPRLGVGSVQSPLPAGLTLDHARLVGRTADLEWLGALWERVHHGDRCVAVVVGPRGSGRSRLVAEFARRVHAAGATVVQPLDAAEVAAVVAAAPGGVPMLVVLDEVDLSRAVTDALDTRPDLVRLVVAVQLTTDGEAAAIGTVRELADLDEAAVRELLSTAVPDPPVELVSAVLAETNGRPALVAEVVERLREQAAAERVERALQRVEQVRAELEAVEDDIAAGVLTRTRAGASARTVPEGTCPYKGLVHFDEADSDVFFGRDRLVASLVAGLTTARLIGVVGASGGGKSSLVRAGLIPALRRGSLPGSDRWPIIVLRPGSDPVGRLRREISDLDLDRASRDAVRDLDAGARMIVVIDQLEEVFTLCTDVAARTTFLDALTRIDSSESPAVIVVTLRADYYGACAAHPDLARLLERNQVLVGALSPSELREVVVEPARAAGLAVQPQLVDAITRDVADQPGMLPLVSTALVETWSRRDHGSLTVAAYREAGGVHGALARLADRVHAGLSTAEQDAARRIFLRVAQLGQGNDDVSRRVSRDELDDDATTRHVLDVLIGGRLLTAEVDTVEVAHEALLREWPQLRAWLEQDRDGRRLHRQLTEAATQWDADGRDASSLYRGARLATATEWAAGHADDLNMLERAFLDAGTTLDQHELHRARRTSRRLRGLATSLALLLVISLVAGGLAITQRGEADREADRATATARRAEANRLAATARSLSSDRSDLALLLGVQGHALDPTLETEGGLEGALVHVQPGIEHIVETGSQVRTLPTALGDGHEVLVTHDDALEVWDVDTGTRVRRQPLTGSTALTVNPTRDGRLVAIGHLNGDVEVRDLADGTTMLPSTPRGPSGAGALWASDDGSRLLTISEVAGTDQQVDQAQMWDLNDPSHPALAAPAEQFPNAGGGVDLGVYLSPDFDRMFTGSVKTAPTTVWDLRSAQQIGSLPIAGAKPVPSIGPDVVAGNLDGRLALLDGRTGAEVGEPFPSLGEPPGPFVVSDDGRRIAVVAASREGLIAVFDVPSRTEVGRIRLQPSSTPVAVRADGRVVVSTGSQLVQWRPGITVPPPGVSLGPDIGPALGVWSEDGSTVVVQHSAYGATNDALAAYDGHTGAAKAGSLRWTKPYVQLGLQAVGVSPDGSIVGLAEPDGVVHLRRASDGVEVARLDAHRQGGELGIVWSPHADRVATFGAGQSVLVWDVSNLAAPKVVGPPLTMPGEPAINPANLFLEFSRDARSMMVIDAPHGVVRRFDVATGATRWTRSLAFFPFIGRLDYTSRDELVVLHGLNISSATGRSLEVRDASTGKLVRSFEAGSIGGNGDALRDGAIIATDSTLPSGDGTDQISVVRLIDRATGTLIGEPLPLGPLPPGLLAVSPYFESAFELTSSPDGTRFISSAPGPGRSVTLWDVDVKHWEATACRIAGRNLTKAEWKRYLPDQQYARTCSQWPAGE